MQPTCCASLAQTAVAAHTLENEAVTDEQGPTDFIVPMALHRGEGARVPASGPLCNLMCLSPGGDENERKLTAPWGLFLLGFGNDSGWEKCLGHREVQPETVL